MKKTVILTSLFLSQMALATNSNIPLSETIKSFTVEEVQAFEDEATSVELYNMFLGTEAPTTPEAPKAEAPKTEAPKTDSAKTEPTPTPTPDEPKPEPKPEVDKIERAGKIIATAKEFVALGEAVYELVKKGKPNNVTTYAPVSVVPTNPETKQPVDVFDLEGFGIPTQKKFTAKLTNGAGLVVISFDYMVVYSYGGSYNGKGKWISSASIIPVAVRTSFGWDFNAEMKVSGIMNHGSKADPVAGLILTVKYSMKSWSSAYERNDTIHMTGKGDFKNFFAQ